MKNLEKIFKGLANRRRLSIIKLLSTGKEFSVAEISDRIKLSFTSTSKHLRILNQLDILDRRQEGLVVYYKLAHPPSQLIKILISLFSYSRE